MALPDAEFATLMGTLLEERTPMLCEHQGHDRDRKHHSGNAEYYLRTVHSCAGSRAPAGTVYAACRKWASVMMLDEPMTCRACGTRFEDRAEFVVVVERI